MRLRSSGEHAQRRKGYRHTRGLAEGTEVKACPGLCTVVDGKAVKLIALTSLLPGREIWDAEEIFVNAPTVVEVSIGRGEDLQELHSKRS